MNFEMLRTKAKEEAEHFLEFDKEYRMGNIEAELPHPKTRYLSQTYQKSVAAGVRLLLSVDEEMSQRAEKTLFSDEYARFADAVRTTLKNGGRVIWSGCGSSGRLCMRLEHSWRSAIENLAAKYPDIDQVLKDKLQAVGCIMTGGDYTVIRAVESFEDSTLLGKEQAKEWKLTEKDLLVGVTATGETTSILGTAMQALEDGAGVYMLICADPIPLTERMERAKLVYNHRNCKYITLPCGPFALTGSSRMQSSTFEQLAGAVALEGALYDILNASGKEISFQGYGWYGQAFSSSIKQLLSDKAIDLIAQASLNEQKIYENGGLITLFADEFLLDVLTDTTERPPTFMTPPFRSLDMKDGEESWAFVKNPRYNTEIAWVRCFAREPRCIEWSDEQYKELGLNDQQIEKIPDISKGALLRFLIGNERMPEREQGEFSHAMWVGTQKAGHDFHNCAHFYKGQSQYTLEDAGLTLQETFMDIYPHLCMKIMLNTLSTGVMARMGKIDGNWMTSLSMSNKKLVDRSARIVSDVCDVEYETALEENFYSRALIEAQNVQMSPAQVTIRRLGIKNKN